MQLSKRLEAIADMVTTGNRLADVGTDHGYLPIYLYEHHRIPQAIAMDIRKGPLERAVLHIREHGLSTYITTRLSDGIEKLLPQEADTLVIAGMGGGLVRKILGQNPEVLATLQELILQPQSEIDQVRLFLEKQEYDIVQENMILEDGKYYPMMRAVKSKRCENQRKEAYTIEQLAYGPLLLQNQHPVLYEYLKKELKTHEDLLVHLQNQDTERARARIEEINKEIRCICAGIRYYDRT